MLRRTSQPLTLTASLRTCVLCHAKPCRARQVHAGCHGLWDVLVCGSRGAAAAAHCALAAWTDGARVQGRGGCCGWEWRGDRRERAVAAHQHTGVQRGMGHTGVCLGVGQSRGECGGGNGAAAASISLARGVLQTPEFSGFQFSGTGAREAAAAGQRAGTCIAKNCGGECGWLRAFMLF